MLNATADVVGSVLATWHDLNTGQLIGLVVYLGYMQYICMDEKIGLMPTKVKINSRPKIDSIDGN